MSLEKKKIDYRDYIGKRVHLIGIGGSSMSGLALMLQNKGFTVAGSSWDEYESLGPLRAAGITVTVGHIADNVTGADLVIHSMAIPKDHIEMKAAAEKGIPVMERSVLLGQLSGEFKQSVAVCGTHGKTTTTSMLAQILVETGQDPSVHIGGVLESIGGNIRLGNSDIFVTEACEYKRSFMNISPTAVILLNIDVDHLDCYRDIDEIEEAFGNFLTKVTSDGWVLGNGEDPRVLRQLKKLKCRVFTFGKAENCDYRIVNEAEDSSGYYSFDLYYKKEHLGIVKMSVPGFFNAMNAAAALGAAHRMGTDMTKACEIVSGFAGAHRRFELTGTLEGAEIFHDYGHTPVEMKNAISIARKRCKKGRLFAVMQPHTYSRVRAMFEDYLICAGEADCILVTNIYAAREPDPGDLSAAMLVDGMKAKGLNAILTPTFEDAAKCIRDSVREGDLVITLGCGDINKLNDML